MAKVRMIVEVEEECLIDLAKIWENEFGVPLESPAEVLQALITEGTTSVNYEHPSLEEVTIVQLDKEE